MWKEAVVSWFESTALNFARGSGDYREKPRDRQSSEQNVERRTATDACPPRVRKYRINTVLRKQFSRL